MRRVATRLTLEERDVLILSGQLLTNEEIARFLGMSIVKVKTLVHQASVKLRARSRYAAAFYALMQGDIRLDEVLSPDDLIERTEGSDVLSKIAQVICERIDIALLPIIDKGVLNMDKKRNTILATREHEVIVLVGRGLTNREISERLCISLDTVRNTMNRICSKLRARSRGDAFVLALKVGEIEISEVMSLDEILRHIDRLKPESLARIDQLLRNKFDQDRFRRDGFGVAVYLPLRVPTQGLCFPSTLNPN